jgi:hypothetical protein
MRRFVLAESERPATAGPRSAEKLVTVALIRLRTKLPFANACNGDSKSEPM